MSAIEGVPVLTLPNWGDNLLLLAEIETALAVLGIDEPVLLRASESEKLERVLAHGTDRAGYPGDRRWRWDPAVAHEDVILATTIAENRDVELGGDPRASSSLRKLPGIPEAMILVYAAAGLECLRPREYRFGDPEAKVQALRAVLVLRKEVLPQGWFSAAEGLGYRALAEAALTEADARGAMVEVGCWLGRSTCYVATLCRLRGARLICVDHWAGSSDSHDRAYREMLDARDIEGEFRRTLTSLAGEGVLELRRQRSLEAAAAMPAESVDLVFLDGSHDREAVAADIEAWRPKLRRGGVLAGHDFSPDYPGVIAAVEAAAANWRVPVECGPGRLWRLRA